MGIRIPAWRFPGGKEMLMPWRERDADAPTPHSNDILEKIRSFFSDVAFAFRRSRHL